MGLTRRQQYFLALETIEGTAATITAATHKLRALDPSSKAVKAMNRRAEVGTSLSLPTLRVGAKSVTFNFALDLASGGALATIPEWGPALRSCGWRETDNGVTYVLTNSTGVIAAISAGDTLTGAGGATATALWANAIENGAIKVFVRSVSGSFLVTENVTVGGVTVFAIDASTATATDGQLYQPDSITADKVEYSAIGSPTVGEVVVGGTSGVKGVYRSSDGSSTVRIEVAHGTGTTFTATETLTGQTSAQTITVHGTPAQAMDYSPSCTILHKMDGAARKGIGCRGNATIELVAGEIGRINFAFTGVHNSSADAALDSSLSYPTATKLRFSAGYFAEGSNKWPVSALSVDGGSSVVMRADPNDTSGYHSAAITDRAPVVNIDPEAQLTGTRDWFADWDAETTTTFDASMGSAEGNRVAIYAPALQAEDISDGDREGIRTHDLTMIPTRNTTDGDDELSIFVA